MANHAEFTDLALPHSQGNSPLTYFKIIFLPILAYIFVLLGYFDIVNFKVHLHTLLMMGFILVIALIFAKHSAELAYAKLAKSSDDFKLGLKNFIMSHLIEISGKKKSNAKFEQFLDDYTKDLRNDNFANICTGLFPMLGILGTFISIAISMPSFDSSDTLGLEKEIGVLLNGIGTAFYVSVYGISLAIWWMFFEKLGLTKFERFANEQKRISSEFFWQKDELEQSFMSLTSRHFDDIRSVFARISNEEFFKNLDNVVGSKFASYKNLQELEQKIISEAQVRVDQNLRLLSKAGLKQEEFLKVNSDIYRALSEFNSSLRDVELKFSTHYNRLNDLNNDRIGGLEKSIAKFDATLKGLDMSLKSFAVKVLEEQNRTLEAFKHSILEGIGEFKKVYDSEVLSEKEQKRNALLNDLKQDASELEKEIERVMKNLENSDETKQ
ncbi:MotA/TolQ/ExbB proton channel family protein [Campylobacter suis]|uniref:MotA/TolQ/ExbB proton channel domain-containing protein n=1 Tax=Campylobacter suis TaxID=2790657 RepID=A0ABN7K3K0_9BACT|nr:MotA/TolQ/ExbB proton channel family protein [Campylobacter suis]CAD7286665.1 hypothetical protein LMG8286_00476 [Campylobacter suis]